MEFTEVREISVIVPVSQDGFYDDKEITELFAYVFNKSELVSRLHPPMRFRVECMCSERVFTFTLSVRANDGNYEFYKGLIELLIDSYGVHERDYLRFRKFGDIESHMLMRK
jgi:hypothetical protein